MRRVLILNREDLTKHAKLKNINEIMIIHFSESITKSQNQIANSDLVIFYCSLLNEYRILKNRYPSEDNGVRKIESPEEENKILTLIMGI